MAGKIYPGSWAKGDYARAIAPAVDAEPMRTGMHDAMARGVDFFSNMPARMGYGTPSMPEATRYELVRLSYDYWLMITLYANHWISRRIIDGPAQDMVRAWPKLSSEMEPKDLKKFEKALRVTGTKQRMLQALKWARLFGGSGALIVIKGHEKQLEEPLELDNVGIGSYLGLIPFDRWVGVWPSGELCGDIRRPTDFNLPEYYTISPHGSTTPVQSPFRVHASRILRFTGPTVPTPEYEARNYWGISVLEPTYEEIRKRDNMSWTILNLTFRSSIIGYREPELVNMLSGLGGTAKSTQQWYARMTALNEAMSNQHMLFLGKDGGLENIQASFGGLDGIYAQFQMDIAGAAEYPVTRLFGRTITGLGQSNDADERIYEERIAMEQEVNERPQLDKLFPVICMSEFGDVPEDLDYDFPSVRVLSEEEKAQLATSSSQVIFAGVNAGIFTKSMALKELKQQSELTGVGTNITDEDIEAAEQEGAAGPGMGGMPMGEEGPAPPGGVPSGKEPPEPPEGSSSEGGEESEREAVGGREPQGNKDLATLRGMAGTKSLKSQSGEQQESSKALANMGGGKLPSLKKDEVKRKHDGKDAVTSRFGARPTDSDLLSRLLQFGTEGKVRVPKQKAASDDEADDDGTGSFAGIPITVECAKGQRRQIKRDDGTSAYDRILGYDYGFINGTTGRDGDEIDCIIGPNPEAHDVYVADMQDLGPDVDQREDEDKVLIGFDTPKAARAAFYSMYPPEFLRGMDTYSADEFRRNWLGDDGEESAEDAGKHDESKHPRVKGGKNAGQFAKKGGEGSATSKPEKKAKPEKKDDPAKKESAPERKEKPAEKDPAAKTAPKTGGREVPKDAGEQFAAATNERDAITEALAGTPFKTKLPKGHPARINTEQVIDEGRKFIADFVVKNPEMEHVRKRLADTRAAERKLNRDIQKDSVFMREYDDTDPRQRTPDQKNKAIHILQSQNDKMTKLGEIKRSRETASTMFAMNLGFSLQDASVSTAARPANAPQPSIKPHFGTGSHPQAREITGNLEQFALITGVSGETANITEIHDPDVRAFYRPTSRSVHLNSNVPMHTVHHEMGHWLEAKFPELQFMTEDFLEYRCHGEKYESMNDIMKKRNDPTAGLYKPNEMAREDKFAHPYTGKKCGTGASEVISMGMENIKYDPMGFQKEDPDYFGFMMGVLLWCNTKGVKQNKP